MTAHGSDRAHLIDDMAGFLLRRGIVGSEADAVRALSFGPYRLGDVAALAEDALLAAQQSPAVSRGR
jgi:hypothetical protein